MPGLKEREIPLSAVASVTTDAPRRRVVVINHPQASPSEWEFERTPARNDVIAREENGLFYKVLGLAACGDLLLEGFESWLELEKAFGGSDSPIRAWLRW